MYTLNSREAINLTRLIMNAKPEKLKIIFDETNPNQILDSAVKDIIEDIEDAYKSLIEKKEPVYGQFVEYRDEHGEEYGIYLGNAKKPQEALVMLSDRLETIGKKFLKPVDRILYMEELDPNDDSRCIFDIQRNELSVIEKLQALLS